MRVEYIGHSGALVQLPTMNLIFDMIAPVIGDHFPEPRHDWGRLPDFDHSLDTVVFASHNHGDHYSEQIWNLRSLCPNLHYVLSKDVHFSSGVRERLGITETDLPHITRVKNYTSQDIDLPAGGRIHVQTIPSTDEGVAFLVKACGRIIYHAGDHHMWMWEENGRQYMDDMAEVFRRTLSRLELAEVGDKDGSGRIANRDPASYSAPATNTTDRPATRAGNTTTGVTAGSATGDTTEPATAPHNFAGAPEVIDVAFLLLDLRLENHAYDGLDTYLECLPIRNVVPIHQWKNYDLTDAYLADRADWLASGTRLSQVEPGSSVKLWKVTGENCCFEMD